MTEMLVIDDLINSIPLMNINGIDFKVKFDFGNINNLQEFVTINKGKQIYPLIYCPTDYKLSFDKDTRLYSGDLTFVVATANQDKNMSNKERLKTSFNLVIKPLVKDFIDKLKYGGYVSVNGELFNEYNYYGYDIGKEYSDNIGLNEYWDAYKFTINLSFKRC